MKALKKRSNSLRSLKPGTPILVHWYDAATWAGWVNHGITLENLDEVHTHYNGMDCYTLGFFVSADKKDLLMAGSRSNRHNADPATGIGDMTVIPTAWIRKLKRVKY